MDPLTLAATAVSFLTNMFSYATEGAAKKAGEAVFDAIRNKCAPDKSRLDALEEFAREPRDPDLAAALRVQLKKLLLADDQFAAQLAALLHTDDVGSSTTTTVTQTAGAGSTQYGIVHGDVKSEVRIERTTDHK
jgi:hypothetical protein